MAALLGGLTVVFAASVLTFLRVPGFRHVVLPGIYVVIEYGARFTTKELPGPGELLAALVLDVILYAGLIFAGMRLIRRKNPVANPVIGNL